MLTSRGKSDDVIIIMTSSMFSDNRNSHTQGNITAQFDGRIITFRRVLLAGFQSPPPGKNAFTPHQVVFDTFRGM